MVRRVLRYLAPGLYYFSLMLPAFEIDDSRVYGFGALIHGWVGVGRSFGWSWLANPLFILSLFLFFSRKSTVRRMAIYTAAAAFLLSLSFLLVDTIPSDGGATMSGVVTLRAGYVIWLYSMAMLLVAAVLNVKEGPKSLPSAGEGRVPGE